MLGPDSGKTQKGGVCNCEVLRSKGNGAAWGPRPVHPVDGAREDTAQR